ncbi:hypothetical protein [Jannaschia pohangensis]|uniref:DUF5666 domain-containing protein n=1 Tax=Jannaschia pohangensis TaxID=390807 RepID=A0A1I3LXR1_9RHOB|nr:hypothetical protein [Jannaschia pohangensis]SFI89340.1 hypothetical protein SAMN04488095_1662 [Jannaschia pohangensis]
MKTIITSALVAVATLAAVPAMADSAAAIAHFNQDLEGGDRIILENVKLDQATVVSTRSGAASEVYMHFNADADRASDLRGQVRATSYGSKASVGADIFAAIRAESAENE